MDAIAEAFKLVLLDKNEEAAKAIVKELTAKYPLHGDWQKLG